MSAHTFAFDDFSENFTLTDYDREPEWDVIEVELGVSWHPAEPDVGINERQPELVDTTFSFDGSTYSSTEALADAFYAKYGDEIDDTVEAVAKVVDKQINSFINEVEDDG